MDNMRMKQITPTVTLGTQNYYGPYFVPYNCTHYNYLSLTGNFLRESVPYGFTLVVLRTKPTLVLFDL